MNDAAIYFAGPVAPCAEDAPSLNEGVYDMPANAGRSTMHISEVASTTKKKSCGTKTWFSITIIVCAFMVGSGVAVVLVFGNGNRSNGK